MKKKLLFIVNPVSGKKNAGDIIKKIKKLINNNDFNISVKLTERPGHAAEMAEQEQEKFDAIIAVGGDGTINEIASQLINTNTCFGIIPNGSGNGLARNLKIPINTVKAIELINNFNTQYIDSAKINEKYFFNVSGVGFDAEIAYLFNQTKNRGFFNYIQLTARKFFKYSEENYIITFGKEAVQKKAFLISFANSNQFGNNAFINPKGKLNDGLIECCVLKKFPLVASVPLAIRLFTKKIYKSKYYKFYQAKSFELILENKCIGHIDGDSTKFEKTIKVDIISNSLNIIC